jgi:hypothetical protein
MVAPFAVEAKIDTLLLLSGDIVAPPYSYKCSKKNPLI